MLFAAGLALLGVAMAQGPVDAQGQPGTPVPTSGTFRFPVASDAGLIEYPNGFALVTCMSPRQTLNISFNKVVPPGGNTLVDVVHATLRQDTDTAGVFTLLENTWYDLSTGTINVLNGSVSVTFNQAQSGMNGALYIKPTDLYTTSALLPYITVGAPASNTTDPGTAAVSLTSSSAWTTNLEKLYYYTGLVTLEASVNGACMNKAGYPQLASLANYLRRSLFTAVNLPTNAALDNITSGPAGEQYTTVSEAGAYPYAALTYNQGFIMADTVVATTTAASQSACQLACRNNNRCNLYHYCSNSAGCTDATAPATNLASQQCRLGFSAAVAANQPVALAQLGNTGSVSGRETAIKPYSVQSPLTMSLSAALAPAPAPAGLSAVPFTVSGVGSAPAPGPMASMPQPMAVPLAPAMPMPAAVPSPMPMPTPAPATPTCSCVIPAGADLNSPTLAQDMVNSGNCPADPSPGCPSGNYGFNNTGGCHQIGCNNMGTNNVGSGNNGSGNRGNNNNGSGLIGNNLSGTGTSVPDALTVVPPAGTATAGRRMKL